MAVFEMSVDKLKIYKGKNPRPEDFDKYWAAALKEMKAIDPGIELIPYKTSSTYAECFDLYFTGVGGARVHSKYLRPKNNQKPHPAICMFHGYSGDSGEWVDKMNYAAQGFCVAALDCRGQGGKSEDVGGVKGNTLRGHIIRGLDDKPERLLFRQIFLDCAQLAGIVMSMPEVDENRVGATGGSQGGGLAIACASLEPRITKAAVQFPFLSDYQRVWEMDLAEHAYEELKAFFRWFDPRHERETEIFTKLGYIDVQHLANRIKGDVLWFIGLMDMVYPPSSQFAAYNKIKSKKEMVIYPDFAHEHLPGITDRIFEFMCGLLR